MNYRLLLDIDVVEFMATLPRREQVALGRRFGVVPCESREVLSCGCPPARQPPSVPLRRFRRKGAGGAGREPEPCPLRKRQSTGALQNADARWVFRPLSQTPFLSCRNSVSARTNPGNSVFPLAKTEFRNEAETLACRTRGCDGRFAKIS